MRILIASLLLSASAFAAAADVVPTRGVKAAVAAASADPRNFRAALRSALLKLPKAELCSALGFSDRNRGLVELVRSVVVSIFGSPPAGCASSHAKLLRKMAEEAKTPDEAELFLRTLSDWPAGEKEVAEMLRSSPEIPALAAARYFRFMGPARAPKLLSRSNEIIWNGYLKGRDQNTPESQYAGQAVSEQRGLFAPRLRETIQSDARTRQRVSSRDLLLYVTSDDEASLSFALTLSESPVSGVSEPARVILYEAGYERLPAALEPRARALAFADAENPGAAPEIREPAWVFLLERAKREPALRPRWTKILEEIQRSVDPKALSAASQLLPQSGDRRELRWMVEPLRGWLKKADPASLSQPEMATAIQNIGLSLDWLDDQDDGFHPPPGPPCMTGPMMAYEAEKDYALLTGGPAPELPKAFVESDEARQARLAAALAKAKARL